LCGSFSTVNAFNIQYFICHRKCSISPTSPTTTSPSSSSAGPSSQQFPVSPPSSQPSTSSSPTSSGAALRLEPAAEPAPPQINGQTPIPEPTSTPGTSTATPRTNNTSGDPKDLLLDSDSLPKYRRDLVAKLKCLRAELHALQPQTGHCRLEVSRKEIFEVCIMFFFYFFFIYFFFIFFPAYFT
jgi:hypothetical protein